MGFARYDGRFTEKDAPSGNYLSSHQFVWLLAGVYLLLCFAQSTHVTDYRFLRIGYCTILFEISPLVDILPSNQYTTIEFRPEISTAE